MENAIIQQLHITSMLTRQQIWWPDAPYFPTVRKEFSLLPRTGFIGCNWESGGTVLIGSNGNSKEGGDYLKYDQLDKKHIKLIENFRQVGDKEAFVNLMNFEKEDIMSWSLYSTIEKILLKIQKKFDEIAILNVIPFSTKDAPSGNSPTWKNSTELHLNPLLKLLEPERIVWMGKAAKNGASPFLNIGDKVNQNTVSRQRNLNWEERLEELI